MALALVGTFVGGAASTYFFHRPQLNIDGIKILALRGLQGTSFTIPSLMIGNIAGMYALNSSSKGTKERNAMFAFLFTYTLCCGATALAAKTLTHRLGTPIEALTNFAVSTVFGYLGAVIS